MPTSGPRRLIDIFPPGFDINSRSLSSRGHYNFDTEQLYQRLTYEYHPEKHIESTMVKSVWYGKQKKSARHEFILVEVEDTQADLKNYMVFDRNPNEALGPTIGCVEIAAPATAGRRRISVYSSSSGGAQDAFRVSYNGIETQLLRECLLLPRDYLEKLEFSSAEPLFLYELVTLAHVVSYKSPNYEMAYRNCYWFAGLIWECLRFLRPNALYDGRLFKKRGKFSILRYTPEPKERDEICDAFKQEMRLVDERLSESRQFWRALSGANERVEQRPRGSDELQDLKPEDLCGLPTISHREISGCGSLTDGVPR